MKLPLGTFGRKRASHVDLCSVIFDHDTGEVVVAERTRGGQIFVRRVSRVERRAANVNAEEVRTVVTGWNAHTDRSHLIEDGNQETDEAILSTLLEVVRESPDPSSGSFAWCRTPSGKIAVTQADSRDVDHTLAQLKLWLNQQKLSHIAQKFEPRIRVETAARLITRFWLHEGTAEVADGETLAVLVVGLEGYSVGLWSERTGLIYETEELFEPDASLETAAAHTCESLIKLIARSSLSKLSLAHVSIVAVSAAHVLEEAIIRTLEHELASQEIRVERVCASRNSNASYANHQPVNQASVMAVGAVLDDHHVPVIDLAIGLESEYEQLIRVREDNAHAAEEKRRRVAVAAMLAPFIVAGGVLCATYFDLQRENARLQQQITHEEGEAQKLKAEAALRISAKGHFAEYLTLINQTLDLRRRQPATAQLLNDLNQQWPQNDATWFISEMKMMPGGVIQLRGRTKKEESITAFTHSLEFSNGLFTGVSNSVQAAQNPYGAVNVTTSGGGDQSLDFTVRALYTPLSSGAAKGEL